MLLNKSLQVRYSGRIFVQAAEWLFQEINIQNMNVELVAQMFKNYQSNVLFHLEGNMACRTLLTHALLISS